MKLAVSVIASLSNAASRKCFSEYILRRSIVDALLLYLLIQLFRGRLCHKSVKANATLSKVIMDNGGFTGACLKLKVFQR